MARGIGERRDATGGAVAEREVQPDDERGIAPGDHHGVVDRWFVHHEAGLREEAGAMGAFDRGVDFRAAPEVVGSKDELFQNAGGVCILRFHPDDAKADDRT